MSDERLSSLHRDPKNALLRALQDLPVRRPFNYAGNYDFTGSHGQRYRIAGEIFQKGEVNQQMCENCERGMQPGNNSWRKLNIVSNSFRTDCNSCS